MTQFYICISQFDVTGTQWVNSLHSWNSRIPNMPLKYFLLAVYRWFDGHTGIWRTTFGLCWCILSINRSRFVFSWLLSGSECVSKWIFLLLLLQISRHVGTLTVPNSWFEDSLVVHPVDSIFADQSLFPFTQALKITTYFHLVTHLYVCIPGHKMFRQCLAA